MAINLAIDDKLIIEAQSIGGNKTKRRGFLTPAHSEALNQYRNSP